MLVKLLKYEFKFTGRTLLPIYVVLVALALLINLGDGLHFDFAATGSLGEFFFTLLIFAYSCMISAVCIITVVLLVQRFYKNLLRDEGYLMHTLPVSPAHNIAAKLICAVVWSIVSIFMAVFSAMLMSMTAHDWKNFFEGFGGLIHNMNIAFGFHWPFFILEGLAVVLLMLAGNIVEVYLALAIGHIANVRKIACSVAAFIGLQVLSGLIGRMLGTFIVNSDWLINLINEIFHGYMHQQIGGVHIIMLMSIAFFFIYTAVMFIATNWIMKRKLNLE